MRYWYGGQYVPTTRTYNTIQYNTLRTAEGFLARAGVELSRRVLVGFNDVVTICA